ncbi:MAG: putative lipid II flippase FtsW [Alphaproteobacteria bacterium]|nr:putative lipid II flippase FtsW [Alphaproteobacteria bacterium]
MNTTSFSRRDNNILAKWWWAVDRWSLWTLLMIIATGLMMSFAASPAVALRLKLDTFFFVKRHVVMMIPTIALIVGLSLLNARQIRRLSVLGYILSFGLIALTLMHGVEIKGARRWVNILGNSIQPSEFMKPFFAVVSAWMMSEKAKNVQFPGIFISFFLLSLVVCVLMMQPDLGMTVVLVATWVTQLFLSGIPILWIMVTFLLGVLLLLFAYIFFPHVTKRIDQFIHPTAADTKHELYQITQSLEAFKSGGLFGRGPGEGVIKKHVPDAHADFVFSVTGEEFGFIICCVIVGLFCFFIIRSIIRLLDQNHLFSVLAACGLVFQFGFQAFVNMGSTLNLIPTKGMTMPFISYGGSSMIALGIGIGMILALTKKTFIPKDIQTDLTHRITRLT